MRRLTGIIALWAAVAVGQEPLPADDTGTVTIVDNTPGPTSAYYGRIEYLTWSFSESPLPTPLLTATDPTQRILLGGGPVDVGSPTGVRLTFGDWVDGSPSFQAVFLYLSGSPSEQTFDDATGERRLTIPFTDAITGRPSGNVLSRPARPVTFVDANGNVVTIPEIIVPGLVASVRFTAKADLFGFEGNQFAEVFRDGGLRVNALAGLRYLGLREELELVASSLRTPMIMGDVFTLADSFETQNHFLGPQVGGRVSWDFGWLSMHFGLKVALGPVVQVTRIDGSLNTNLFARDLGQPPTENTGGTLAQESNIGGDYRIAWAIVPEFQAGVGCKLAPGLRLNLGFTLTAISNVARPGDQIDPRVNPTRSLSLGQGVTPPTGPNLPARLDKTGTFRTTGTSIGLEFSY